MARTKRKTNPVIPAAEAPAQAQKQYRAAAYARLSVEDSGKPGADTIEGQKALLTSFIESSSDMELVALFCDNGRTGTDFDRPQFEKMMEAVKRGEVDCIVVKDLSRFGRNYKETGNYLERIFPFLGVRFIAVNDGFDSNAVIEQFKSYAGITALTKEISADLLQSVTIYPDGRMDIRLNLADEIKALMEALRRESCTA